MNIKFLFVLSSLGIAIVIGTFFAISQTNSDIELSPDNISVETISSNSDIENISQDVMITDGKKHIISLDKIKGGGPPKDGIPSIDNPKFATIENSQFISDSDIIIGLEINGDVRAYPLFILVWHEIVNDTVGESLLLSHIVPCVIQIKCLKE